MDTLIRLPRMVNSLDPDQTAENGSVDLGSVDLHNTAKKEWQIV